MAIKVIIMDIDGTLVNDEKVITPLTKETLLKAQDKGVRLVLASGRPTSGLLKLAEELDMESLKKVGPVIELKQEDIFGY